jgi:hypothetical protein
MKSTHVIVLVVLLVSAAIIGGVIGVELFLLVGLLLGAYG